MQMLTAKPVVKDKFWIVEEDGTKVATIQSTDDGVVYVHDQFREKFPSVKLLSKKYNITFDKSKISTKKQTNSVGEYTVYGYPTPFKPYNELFDVAKKLPIFTKTKKSKSFYCAGYYIIKFNNGWVKSQAPKLITLNRYPYQGPYRDKADMQEQLRIANESLIK